VLVFLPAGGNSKRTLLARPDEESFEGAAFLGDEAREELRFARAEQLAHLDRSRVAAG